MIIGRVTKSIISTIKADVYQGHKLFLVEPLDQYGKKKIKSAPIVAVDTVRAGVGDIVLIMREGNGTRQILGIKNQPIRALIVGIIDQISTD